MSKIFEINIPKPYHPKANPIKSPGFLDWLKNKRRQKRRQEELKKRLTREKQIKENLYAKQTAFNKMKQYRTRTKQYRTWLLIRKHFYNQTGDDPPYTIKKWFYS